MGKISRIIVLFLLFVLIVEMVPMILASPAQRLVYSNTTSQPNVPSNINAGKISSLGLLQTGQIQFSISFSIRNSEALNSFIENSHKQTLGVQQVLTEQQFEADYSPTQEDYDSVISFLSSRNLSVTQTFSNRLLLTAEGSVADVQRAFNTQIGLFANQNTTFYRSISDVTVPALLKQCSIAGINMNSLPNAPNFVSVSQNAQLEISPDAASAQLYGSPSDFRATYGTTQAFLNGWNGTGTTIAIVDAYGDPSIINDSNLFNAYYGLPNETITIEGSQVSNGLGWDSETALDVEWAHAMAPGAAILLKAAASTSDADMYAAVNSLVSRTNPPNIISLSWGRIEESSDPNLSQIFAVAASKGIKVFVSTGDHGAYNNDIFGVSYPAADPNVIAVGGTEVYYNTVQGTRQCYEVGWSDNGNGWASGGGYSTVFNEPAYQVNAGIPDVTGKRGVPDVSLTGGPASAVRIYCGGIAYGSYGTSLSAPMMAGIAAAALNGGWNLNNNAFYSLYSSSSNYNAAFHDVYLSGNNSYYTVQPGWDAVTGLGSINFQNFVNFNNQSTPLSLNSQSLSSTSVVHGQTFSFNYNVNNPSSYSLVQIGLGASIRLHGTTTETKDSANDIYVTLPGESSSQSRQFATSSSLTPGSYDVNWGIWMGPPGMGNLLSSSGWQMNQLQILSSSSEFDFNIASSPSSRTIPVGGSTTYSITSTLTSGTASTISLSCTNVIGGVSYSFNQASGTPTFSSIFTVQTSQSTPQGSYALIISATGGGKTHSTTINLNVGDNYEPDDSFSQYSSMSVTSSLQSQSRSIEPASDNDYIRFYATPGTYMFFTAGTTDTYGYLYDSNQNLLTYDDDLAGNLQFEISYQIQTSGYYFLRITSFLSVINGPYTLYYSYTPVPPAPNPISPTNGAFTASNSTAFSWSSSSGASSYQIQITGSSSGTYNTSVPSEMIQPMSEGAYTWRVRAYNSSGWSDWTPAWAFTLDTSPPSTPNPDDSISGWNTINTPSFTWSASDTVSGIAGYYWKIDGGVEVWTTTAAVTVPSQTDGSHIFYVKAKDNAGNNGTYGSHSFQIDSTNPSGTLSINQGAQYSTSTSVTLTLTYLDSNSGVDKVRFSSDGVWDSEPWENAAATKAWLLTSGDGAKTVYYQIRDNAGLLSSTYSTSITLDTLAPTGLVLINNGATYTNSATVNLALSATDITSGIAQMRFSNDNQIWSSWETYSTSKIWTLQSNDGTKNVYLQYKDNAGLSSSYSASIILDTTSPAADGGQSQTVTQGHSVTFDASSSADSSGITSYVWDFGDGAQGSGVTAAHTYSNPGTYTAKLTVTDSAGNIASVNVNVLIQAQSTPTPAPPASTSTSAANPSAKPVTPTPTTHPAASPSPTATTPPSTEQSTSTQPANQTMTIIIAAVIGGVVFAVIGVVFALNSRKNKR